MQILPSSSPLYKTFQEMAQTRRMVFLAGLPGTGKSLLIQQLTHLATQAGRTVHLMQYDVSRKPFETVENLAKYPEIDGVTHAGVRKAVGLWSRGAVQQWCEKHPSATHLLIGEVPLIGNRLIELVQPIDDLAEAHLTMDDALFVVPVPSKAVRAVIEEARAKSIANPQHEKEKSDAPPHVIQQLWQEIIDAARQIGLMQGDDERPYHPDIYGGVYEALLRYRHAQIVPIEEVLQPTKSVYELDAVIHEVAPDGAEVARILQQMETLYTDQSLVESVDNWHSILTG